MAHYDQHPHGGTGGELSAGYLDPLKGILPGTVTLSAFLPACAHILVVCTATGRISLTELTEILLRAAATAVTIALP